MRPDRRRDLLRILREGSASSQKEIVRALQRAGHDVTQATVSRDLREIGASKVRSAEGFVYRLADDVPHSWNGDLVARNLDRSLAEFALDIRRAHSLVIVTTAPGHASAVARAIDLAAAEPVMGTVAGDDTIFVATESPDAAASLAQRWWREISSAEQTARLDNQGASR
jgi:transcriptional regulator of arginine metabolism